VLVPVGGCLEHYVRGEEMRAPAVRIRPGACSWYHGAVLVESRTAQLDGKFVSDRIERGEGG
jgi:hypothetical protein